MRMSLTRRGKKHHASKLSTTEVHRLRAMYDRHTPLGEIAEKFKVSMSRVVAIGKRRGWSWLAERAKRKAG